jgi:hypothetical protein
MSRSARKEANKMRKRVIYLESLLSANLDNLTSQQKYYDSELHKAKASIKRMTAALDSYEK